MKYVYATLVAIVLVVIGFYMLNDYIYQEKQGDSAASPVEVTPIEHASLVLKWGETIVYSDPVGGANAFAQQPKPAVVLVTHLHGDHMDPETLSAVLGDAVLIAPQSVKDALPEELAPRVSVLSTGETTEVGGITIQAVPAYNLSEEQQMYHPKSRGDNGYVLEKDGYRVYIAGDTSGTPEMRALKDIDMAFVPMNLPYTMDVEEAASAVLDFKPKTVIPYHYRGQNGLSDVEKFKSLVNDGDSGIQVELLKWY